MLEGFVFGIFYNPVKFAIFIASLILSILFLYYSSKAKNIKTKLSLIYLHVLFFIVPLVIMAFSSSCKIPVFNCTTKQFIIFVLGAGIGLFVIGFFLVPYIYLALNKNKEIKDKTMTSFIKKHSTLMKIRTPKIFYINSAKPYAYSVKTIKGAVFISVGMFELLSKKQIEAVILHELYHIKQRSSFYKFSTVFLKTFSVTPAFLNLNKNLEDEEKKADLFAVKVQKTNAYINTAKKRISLFSNKSD